MPRVKKAAKEFIKKVGKRRITLEILEKYISDEGYELYEYPHDHGCGYENDVIMLLKSIGKYEYSQEVYAFIYTDESKKLLFIKQHLTSTERLTLLSHEVGHIYLKHLTEKGVFVSNVEQEDEANRFSYLIRKNYSTEKTPILLSLSVIFAVIVFATVSNFILSESAPLSTKSQTSIYSQTTQQDGTQTQDSIVSITRTGDKYHMSWCNTISDNITYQIELSEAINLGYEPCKICRPDINITK